MKITKAWATPITIGAFILMAVTGILMFFDLDSGYNKRAHEIFSWVFVGGVFFHIFTSWSGFKSYFYKPLGLILIGALVLVLGFSFYQPQQEQRNRLPVQKVISKLNSKQINDLAVFAGINRDSLLVQLNQAGFQVTDGSETVQGLARGERGNEAKIYNLIFK